MKELITSRIFSFILGAVIFSGLTVFAYSLTSKDIKFTPADSEWQVDNVKDAVDDLYNNFYSNELTTSYQFGANSYSFTSFQNRIYLSGYQNKFKYFMITKASAPSSIASRCTSIYFNSEADQSIGNLSVGVQYNLADYSRIISYVTGTNGCFYDVNIKYYN